VTADALLANHERPERSPCVPVAALLLSGIAAGQAVEFSPATLFGGAGLIVAGLCLGRGVRRPVRVGALLTLFFVVGAAAGQAAWRDRGPASVTRLATAEPKLIRLTGVLADSPVMDRRRDAGRRAAWLLADRTRVTVDARTVAREELTPLEISGRVQIASAGHLSHVAVGDRIDVTGWLVRPGGSRNPGGFDAASYLRSRGIDAVVYVDHPEAVRRVETGRSGLRRRLAELRGRLGDRFARHLSPRNGPVGTAMILGDRSAMPVDIRDAYVASGAMHILAISGMNVGIFAVLLVVAGRLLNLSSGVITVAVVGCAWAYAGLTNLEPPVVRASVFLTLWGLSVHCLRRASLLDVAAATAIVLAIFDPLLLFDIGARLSFLAVLGMGWAARSLTGPRELFVDMADERPWVASAARWLWATQVLSLGTWVLAAPLVAAEFRMISAVGLFLNVVLVPVATLVMWCGYLLFAACLVAPWAAAPFGAAFDWGLSVVNWMVVAAGDWELGHVATPAVPGWWLAGFYGLLFAGLLRPRWAGRRVRSLAFLAAWTAAGLAAAFLPGTGAGGSLRMTVLDVGHGGAVLIETPGGRRMLYDCGSMVDDRRAAEIVWGAVRERGGFAIDLLVVSHADLDHCNNVPALLRGGPVGTVAVPRSFLDFGQSTVREACDAAGEAGTPIRLLAAGDRIAFEPEVAVEVLHPTDGPPGEDDNSNSAVIRITYAGRTILLTGDLEGGGQTELFDREPAAAHDVVVAPHHGGLKANTIEFAEWCRPKAVAVSSGDRVDEESLREIYRGARRLYLTPRDGAIEVEVSQAGRVSFDSAADRG